MSRDLISRKRFSVEIDPEKLLPSAAEILKEYSLAFSFILFYVSLFWVTRSLGIFSYDVMGLSVTGALFAVSVFWRDRGFVVLEEFFRTNVVLFSVAYAAIFLMRIFSGGWALDPLFSLNILLTLAGYVFVIRFHRSIGVHTKALFIAGSMLYGTLAAVFWTLNLLSISGAYQRLESAGVDATAVCGFVFLCASVLLRSVTDFSAWTRRYGDVFLSLRTFFFVAGFAIFFFHAFFIDAWGAFFRACLLLVTVLGVVYEAERPSGWTLAGVYLGTVFLFLQAVFPGIQDSARVLFVPGSASVAFGYAYPLFVTFFLPFFAVGLSYSRLTGRRSVHQSLLVAAIAYSIAVFLATLALGTWIPDGRVYAPIGFFFESVLLFSVAVRFRGMKIDRGHENP